MTNIFILIRSICCLFVLFQAHEALDICKQYSLGSIVFNSFYCIDYCCGGCSFRYCCSNETLVVEQEECANTLTTTIKSHSRTTYSTPEPLIVSTTQPTFGNESKQVNKTLVYGETCDSFYDKNDGVLVTARRCGTGLYCCGNCANRFCCSSMKQRVNQNECQRRPVGKQMNGATTGTNENSSIYNPLSYIYALLAISSVMLLAIACVPFVVFVNKKSHKTPPDSESHLASAVQTLAPVNYMTNCDTMISDSRMSMSRGSGSSGALCTSSLNPGDIVTSLNLSKYCISGVLHDDDDLPPAYSTLSFEYTG